VDALDLGDALDAYFGLRSVFVSDPSEIPIFDRRFWALWGQEQQGEGTAGTDTDPEERADAPEVETSRRDEDGSSVVESLRAGGGDPSRVREPIEDEEETEALTGAAYSPVEALSGRSFASLGPAELRRVEREIDRIMVRLATRRSRRLRPSRRRGKVDLRRSFRGALAHDGEILRLARRDRRVDRPKVVLLCDVSGSMERYSRFLLRFLISAGRSRDVEAFVFSTRLTRVTSWLTGSGRDDALDALGREVRDWSGGTRIGASLEAFLERHGRALLGQKSVVVILSDGLDRGDTERLERAMRGISRRARKVIWLNPLLESPDYRPEARGMKAALPFVDHFEPGHSLEALRELVRLIRL
jgi:uncharacterized protein with von Willebrand factor type A (vWA) domain